MIPILFPESETAFTGSGLGRLADCISCDVSEELNSTFECVFKYPRNGPMYSLLQPGKIILSSYDVSGTNEPFDIYAKEVNLDGTATYRAHHISYRLNTLMFRPYVLIGAIDYWGATWELVIDCLKDNSPYNGRLNKLKYGSTSFSTSGYGSYVNSKVGIKPTKMMSLREIILGGENSVVGQSGAEIKWVKLACTFNKRRGTDTSAVIRYSSNLSAMRYEYDDSAVVDAVVPYWIDSERGVWLMPYLDSTATSYPGDAIAAPINGEHVYTERDNFSAIPLDVSSQFSEKPTADDVYDYTCDYYNTHSIGKPYENLTIEFIPLWDTPEYKYIAPAEKLKLGDTATVVFPEYNLIKPLRLVKTTWDALNERYTAMEFGTVQRTIYNVNTPGGTAEETEEGTVIIVDEDVEE